MIQHFDKRQNKAIREKCFGEEVFVMLHSVLRAEYEAQHTAFTPFEIWAAASQVSKQLLEFSMPEEQLDYLLEELREECETDEDVYYVLLTVSFQIAPYRKQRADIDKLVMLLMPYLRKHADYREHMSAIGQKELYLNRRINLLEYELKEMIAEGGTSEDVQRLLELWVLGSKETSPAAIEHNLLLLNFINLELGHTLDEYVKKMFEHLGYKTQNKPTTQYEITLGNKNLANEGSIQMNTPMPADNAGLVQLMNSLKALTDGKR